MRLMRCHGKKEENKRRKRERKREMDWAREKKDERRRKMNTGLQSARVEMKK
jgi:hypothetical protein